MILDSRKAAIFRITHIDNVEWDLTHGLQCRSSAIVNPNFRNIGNLSLIEKRKSRIVPIQPGGTLSDYVPFYFTSRSPMLYNIRTGHNGIQKVPMGEIVIYAASLRKIAAAGHRFVFTDRHAKLAMAEFSNDLDDLDTIDWEILQNSDFKHDPSDLEKMDRYQAEALIYDSVPCGIISAMLCHDSAAKEYVEEIIQRAGLSIPVMVKPGMFF